MQQFLKEIFVIIFALFKLKLSLHVQLFVISIISLSLKEILIIIFALFKSKLSLHVPLFVILIISFSLFVIFCTIFWGQFLIWQLPVFYNIKMSKVKMFPFHLLDVLHKVDEWEQECLHLSRVSWFEVSSKIYFIGIISGIRHKYFYLWTSD